MKHAKFNHYVSQLCISAGLLLALLAPSTGVSQVLALPDSPFDGSSTTLKPNFMYVLDNSYSMNYDHTNDALGTSLPTGGVSTNFGRVSDSLQCKVAMKNKGGNPITALSRSGTVLTITTSGSYSTGNKVYLAVPGNPDFSGTYTIATGTSSGTPAVYGPCPAANVVITSNPPTHHNAVAAAIGAVVKVGEHGIICNNCGTESQTFTPACSVTAAQPANVPNFSNDVNRGGGTDASCFWRDLKDTAAVAAYDTNNPDTISCSVALPLISPAVPSGTSITVAVENAGTSGAFSATEVADARIATKADDTACRNEPPQYSNRVNSLFYDPKVNYEPPPWPKNLTSAVVSDRFLPSMNRANTANWTSVRVDGTKLDASGNPYIGNNGTTCQLTTNNRLACNNTYRAPNGNYDFKQWREMVYCETPDIPSLNKDTGLPFTGATSALRDKQWHESSSCKQNLLATNTTKLSANYPYQYPAHKDGNLLADPDTKFYDNIILHQNGKTMLSTENPVADLYAYGEFYEFANPHYFNINPIEYCDTAKLKNCTLSYTPTGIYTFPSYVRYCKTAAQATNAGVVPAATECQSLYTSTFKFARYGLFERIDVTPKIAPLNVVDKTFFKYSNRTDCTGSFGAGGCSYDEEMTNLANWYAYYRNRIQLMKSASGNAFNALGNSYRVGFMTINQPELAGQYLPISDFGTTDDSTASFSANSFTPNQKRDWLIDLYSIFPKDTTPLKDALSVAGRIYAGKTPIPAPSGWSTSNDPMQYACQQNFTLLTTDGYWNDIQSGKQVDGTTLIGNLDSDETTSPRPKFEGNIASGTLADVAKYYADTDIRDTTFNVASPAFNSCQGAVAGENVCSSQKGNQKMTTLTLGLGVDGDLSYTDSKYEDATSGDFFDIKNGTKDWPVPVANSPTAVDDLWHAAVNGNGTYFSAKSPKELKDALKDVISGIDQALKSGSPAAVSSLEPTGGDYGFSTSYVSEEWSGNLVARELSTDLGEFYKTVTPAPAVWCADNKSILDLSITACPNTNKLSDRVTATGENNRLIYTAKDDGSGDLMEFKHSLMSAAQKNYFSAGYLNGKLSQYTSLSADIITAGGDSLVKYLRGQTAYENDGDTSKPANQKIYRDRSAVLGDITDSNPVHVGKPLFNYSEGGYNKFRDNANLAAANKTVYVGANDGMLHAFDATNGNERWAYIPSILLPKLHKLADFNYSSGHVNYVNGDPVVGDICVSGCTTDNGVWKTILVGGLAQGGKGYYALDITNPNAPSLLWEFNSSDDSDLGFTYGMPVITKKSDGTWVVLVASGYNNGSAGRLFVLKADLGSTAGKADKLSEIVTPAANDSGLAQISGLAINNQTNNQTKYVYGGDLLGNLWKFDIDTASVSLFTTVAPNQAITVPPIVVKEQNDTLVLFGTGRLLELSDILTSATQSLYAIRDDGSATFTDPHGNSDFEEHIFDTNLATKTRKVSAHVNGAGTKGWYIDLDPGERQTVMAQLLGGVLTVPTIVKKGDACSPEGYSWVNQLNYSTGASLDNNPDTNVGTYTDAPVTGLVALVKKNASGGGELETTSHTTECTPGSPDCPKVIDPATLLTSGGAFGGHHLIWRELTD